MTFRTARTMTFATAGLVLTAILAAAPAPVSAQQRSVAAATAPAGAQPRPVAGIQLDLQLPNGSIRTVTTGRDGKFVFPGLAPGKYVLLGLKNPTGTRCEVLSAAKSAPAPGARVQPNVLTIELGPERPGAASASKGYCSGHAGDARMVFEVTSNPGTVSGSVTSK